MSSEWITPCLVIAVGLGLWLIHNELEIPEPVCAEVNLDELVIIADKFVIEENSFTKNLMEEQPQIEWRGKKRRREEPSSVSSPPSSPRPELQYALS